MDATALANLGSLVPSAEQTAPMVLAFLAGSSCPVYYAEERLRGFGRALLSRLPYAPPPGMNEEQAMAAAASAEADQVAGENTQSGDEKTPT